MTAPKAPQLEPTVTDRGFAHMPDLNDSYDRKVIRVYESSSAEGPHVWLSIREDEVADAEAYAHLTAENAWRLADQLRTLVVNHYYGDASPKWLDPIPHRAQRGSDVEAWLKAKRDAMTDSFGDPVDARDYDLIDGLLDDYRLHADTGEPLTTPTEQLGPTTAGVTDDA